MLSVIRRYKDGMTVLPQHLDAIRSASEKSLEALGMVS